MANNKDNKVVHIDPIYVKYRKMWRENRWQFSGDLVKLTIKQNKPIGLDKLEEHTLNAINRVLDENNNDWLDGYEWTEGVLRPKKK
jgi:hypothetical protein